MFNTISLDDTAKAYVQNCLKQGGKYANVLANAPSGKVTTFLPDQLDYSHINYSRSIHLTFGIRIYDTARKNIYKIVKLFLQGGTDRYAIIETYYDSSDLKKLDSVPSVVSSENEIYFLLKSNAEDQEIKYAFSSARDYPFVCGLIDLGGVNFALVENQTIQSDWW